MTTLKINDDALLKNIYAHSITAERALGGYRGGSVFLAYQPPPTMILKVCFLDRIPEIIQRHFLYGRIIEEVTLIEDIAQENITGTMRHIFKHVCINKYKQVPNEDNELPLYMVYMKSLKYEIMLSPEIRKLVQLNHLINSGEIRIGVNGV